MESREIFRVTVAAIVCSYYVLRRSATVKNLHYQSRKAVAVTVIVKDKKSV